MYFQLQNLLAVLIASIDMLYFVGVACRGVVSHARKSPFFFLKSGAAMAAPAALAAPAAPMPLALMTIIHTLIRAHCAFRITLCFPDIFVKRATVDVRYIIYIYIPLECIELSSVGLRSGSSQLFACVHNL